MAGLVRTKNMLSVMTQVGAAGALAMLVWVLWGYTMAFGDGGNAFIAGFGKALLSGITPDSHRPRPSRPAWRSRNMCSSASR